MTQMEDWGLTQYVHATYWQITLKTFKEFIAYLLVLLLLRNLLELNKITLFLVKKIKKKRL